MAIALTPDYEAWIAMNEARLASQEWTRRVWYPRLEASLVEGLLEGEWSGFVPPGMRRGRHRRRTGRRRRRRT